MLKEGEEGRERGKDEQKGRGEGGARGSGRTRRDSVSSIGSSVGSVRKAFRNGPALETRKHLWSSNC